MTDLIHLILTAFYFILPTYISNMVLVYLWFRGLREKKFGFLSIPIDFGFKIKGRPIFGEHRRFDGLVFPILIASFVVWVQQIFYPTLSSYSVINYPAYNAFLLGCIFGGGNFLGNLLNSFIKRRMNFPPHSSFPIVDQIDNVLGTLLLASIWLQVPLGVALTTCLISIPLTMLINIISYKLKIKDVWW